VAVDHWAETIGGQGVPSCGDDCNDAERAQAQDPTPSGA
jgi:hypothetical protein